MGVIHIPDDLERLIARGVADGLAANPAEFLRDAVTRLVDAERAAAAELEAVIEAGEADIAAGRLVTVATPADRKALEDRLGLHLREGRVARQA